MALTLFIVAVSLAVGAGFHWWLATKTEHRVYAKSTPDLVNWQNIEHPLKKGVIRLKGGGLMATYQYRGTDLNSAEPSQRNLMSELLNNFFKKYENGWVFYFNTLRDKTEGYPDRGMFPDPVSKAIDDERRARDESGQSHYCSHYYLSIIWSPSYDATMDEFTSKLSDIEDELDRVLSPRRLPAEEHLSFLHKCMWNIDQPITAPQQTEPIDQLLANHDVQVLPTYDANKYPIRTKLGLSASDNLIVGDKYNRIICITGFPNTTYNGILQNLNTLDCTYRWSTRIITMDVESQENKIKGLRNKFRIGRKGVGAAITDGMGSDGGGNDSLNEAYQNIDAMSMMKDASLALSEVTDNSTSFAVCTSSIVVTANTVDSLNEKVSMFLSTVRQAGFTGSIEDHQALDSWIGSLPGHSNNIRRKFISTYNISDMIPTWLMWGGSDQNPSPMMEEASPHFQAKTAYGEPFKKQRPASGDVGHSIIVGSTGTGKSTYVNFEIAQWLRHKNAQVFLFDKGYTGQLLCQACGGNHYDLFNDDTISFQPLKDISSASGAEMVWTQEWVEDLVKLQGITTSPKQRGHIKAALSKVAEQPPRNRTITQLIIQLQDRQLSEALQSYSRDGKYGTILDSHSDPIEDSHYQVFELEHINALSDEILLPVLMYLFHRVEQSLSKDRPTLIYIEEAWMAFGNEQFSQKLKQWLVTLRKQNGHVGLVTHSPEQFLELDSPSLFIGSAPERVFLPNPNATQPDTAKLYNLFGLNDEQKQAIAKGQPKREYYIQTPAGSAMIDLDLTPLSLGFIADPSGMSVPQRQRKVQSLIAEFGDRWPVEWLRELDLASNADKLDSLI